MPLQGLRLEPSFRLSIGRCYVAVWCPELGAISKIIYDQSTGNIHISGFQMGWPFLDPLEWSDTCFVQYRLAKRPNKMD
ncbi:uncharacterized protein N7496_008126 [Penicillium cataractarum]|uniref:Uncharacterized protein n=1 Tax=Penicillium cataractarum TaxID=2100454 RepID=A0A9W9V6S3_9EURO|nr:uncharacterized protein N7496_008126 [Penicillium cataractarum]KAJ5368366.1 hypothetical protein N7496_008126 [Penicillium cataractarum]